jgi:hypothetical protein
MAHEPLTTPTLTCAVFRRMVRNSLRGFADILIDDLDLILRECPCHVSHGRRWVGMPARTQVQDGTVLTDARGKTLYVALLDFSDRWSRDAFADAAVEAVIAHTPTAFDAEDNP